MDELMPSYIDGSSDTREEGKEKKEDILPSHNGKSGITTLYRRKEVKDESQENLDGKSKGERLSSETKHNLAIDTVEVCVAESKRLEGTKISLYFLEMRAEEIKDEDGNDNEGDSNDTDREPVAHTLDEVEVVLGVDAGHVDLIATFSCHGIAERTYIAKIFHLYRIILAKSRYSLMNMKII
jgi:hypothetical protein